MSEKRSKIEEILNELTLEDVLLMVEIASAYIEKLMRARAKLQRIYTLLGLSKSVSERELLYSIIESTIRQAGRAEAVEQAEETPEETEASRRKLREILEKIKREEKSEKTGIA